MKTGIELIGAERREQINKHGITPGHDRRHNNKGQLIDGAIGMLMNNDTYTKAKNITPDGWDKDVWQRMLNKPEKDRYIIAGALIAAHLDSQFEELAPEEPMPMVFKKSWVDFRKTGLLLFINQILHVFGWVICYEFVNGEAKIVYPARTKFRGFDQDNVGESYREITGYLKENIDELHKEANL